MLEAVGATWARSHPWHVTATGINGMRRLHIRHGTVCAVPLIPVPLNEQPGPVPLPVALTGRLRVGEDSEVRIRRVVRRFSGVPLALAGSADSATGSATGSEYTTAGGSSTGSTEPRRVKKSASTAVSITGYGSHAAHCHTGRSRPGATDTAVPSSAGKLKLPAARSPSHTGRPTPSPSQTSLPLAVASSTT